MDKKRENIRDIMMSVNVICQIYDNMAKNLGIRSEMLSLLYALDDGNTYTQTDICHKWNIPKTTINGVIQDGCKKGLIKLEENPSNRKEKFIKITDFGKVFSNEVLSCIYKLEEEAFNDDILTSDCAKSLSTFSIRLARLSKQYFDSLSLANKKLDLECLLYKENHNYDKELRKLYHDAFPINERIPFDQITEYRDIIDINIFTYNSNFVGFSINVLYKDLLYVLYFAMTSKYRSKGFGSQAMELIRRNNLDKSIVLDIEAINPNSTNSLERIKRKKFYLRAGFMETGIEYYQKNVLFEVLCLGKLVTIDCIDDFWNHMPNNLFKNYKT